jgi:hypothetical protein
MRNKFHSNVIFFIEDNLLSTDQGKVISQAIYENGGVQSDRIDESRLNIIFSNQVNNRAIGKIKNKILITNKSEIIESSSSYEVDFNSYDEVSGIIITIITADWWSSINYKLKESEKILEQIKKKNLSGDESVVSKISQEIEIILDLELMLLKEDDLEKWNLLLKNFCKKNHIFSSLSFLKAQDLHQDESILDPHSLIFQMTLGAYFVTLKDKNISNPEEELKLELLLLILSKSVQAIDYTDNKDAGEIEFWKKIFSKIPYPMAVISPLGELLIYNEHFATLGILPRECLSLKDNDHLELNQLHYKISRFDFSFHGTNVHYYIFYTSEKIMNNPNNELGIVSSSIAHELNNPLAGILAALSLLRLEDEWSEEAIIEIEEMKNGAKRCKELIEIFLGFSRFSPKISGGGSLKLSLDQAINLLRFRMVESDLRIDMRLSVSDENQSFDINSSVLSMIFYLILSELMTAFAHHRLLSPRASSLLEGNVFGTLNQVQFILYEDFDYEKNILNSKLLQHLLFFEKLEMVFLKKEIRIIKNYK